MTKVGCWNWSFVSGKIICTAMGFTFLDEMMPPFIPYSSIPYVYELTDDEDVIQFQQDLQERNGCQIGTIASWESKDTLIFDKSKNDLKNVRAFALKESNRSSYDKLEVNFLFSEEKEPFEYG